MVGTVDKHVTMKVETIDKAKDIDEEVELKRFSNQKNFGFSDEAPLISIDCLKQLKR